MAQEVSEPLTVLHIRLAAGHRLHVARIDQQDGAAVFQEVVHRPPKHPGRFHGHMRHAQGFQPFGQRQQIGRHGAIRPCLLLHALLRHARSRAQQHRHHHCALVHIHTRTPLIDHLHLLAPFYLRFFGATVGIGELRVGARRRQVSLACSRLVGNAPSNTQRFCSGSRQQSGVLDAPGARF